MQPNNEVELAGRRPQCTDLYQTLWLDSMLTCHAILSISAKHLVFVLSGKYTPIKSFKLNQLNQKIIKSFEFKSLNYLGNTLQSTFAFIYPQYKTTTERL